MFLRLLLVLFLIFTLSLQAKKPGDKPRIIVSQIAEDEYRIRTYLNFENPYETHKEFDKPINQLINNMPTPSRFEVTGMRKFLTYKTGLSVSPKSSYILELVNKHVIFQAPLITELGVGVTESIGYDIPLDKLYEGYNLHTTYLIQNGIQTIGAGGTGGGSSSSEVQKASLKFSAQDITEHICGVKKGKGSASSGGGARIWTQIYTEDSYLEYDFKLKPFEERLSSIYRFIIDNKNMLDSRINLVFPEKPSEYDINNYGLLANILGYLLKFRDVKFSVSTEIDNRLNNIIVMPRKSVKDVLAKYVAENNITFESYKEYAELLKDFKFSYDDQVGGNINIIQNPIQNSNGILIITGETQKDVESGLFKLIDKQLETNQEQYLVVKNIERPPKAKPFSSPKFIHFGKNINFTDPTFFQQDNCSDTYTSTYGANFQVYPIVSSKKDLLHQYIDIDIDYFAINSPDVMFMFNIYINDILTQQFFQKNQLKTISGVTREQGLVNLSLLKEGMNEIQIEIVKYPAKENISFGIEAVQTKIQDSSSFNIPKILPKVKYPNLKYISEMAFPFSIYPDLQNTGILITDFNADTIASAMQIAFQLGKKIDSPGYYLTTTYNINSVLDKDIIVIGTQIEEYALLFKNAPIKFTSTGITKEKYSEKYETTTITQEYLDFSDSIVAQTYQSIFNPKRIIFEITAKNPATLLMGIQDGLNPKNMGTFHGDHWVYDVNKKESYSTRLQKEYLVDEIIDGYKIDYNDGKYKNIEEF